MDIQTLIKTDLNLLVTLYVLYEERSVSRAAERLFITQSAVSKALSRMRERFDDQLFTRAGHELVPSPYLESKAQLLAVTLGDISRLFAPLEFEPETCEAEIRVTYPEMIDLVVTPRLFAYLQFNAPGIRIRSEHYGEDVLDRLAMGTVDFAISLEYSYYPPEYETEHFIGSYPAVVARKGHPLEGDRVEYSEVIKYPRISVMLPDQALTDFYRTFLSRRLDDNTWPAFYETENMMSALSIVSLTDSLLPVPGFVAETLVAATDLQKFSMSEYDNNLFNYNIVSHKRTSDSPMLLWFGQVLKNIGREVMAEVQK